MKKKYIVSSHANYFIILLTLSQSKSIKESNLYIYIYIWTNRREIEHGLVNVRHFVLCDRDLAKLQNNRGVLLI